MHLALGELIAPETAVLELVTTRPVRAGIQSPECDDATDEAAADRPVHHLAIEVPKSPSPQSSLFLGTAGSPAISPSLVVIHCTTADTAHTNP